MSLISDWAVNTARGVGNALNTYYQKVSKPIGRTISTGLLLTDKDNPVYKDGFQLSDVGQTYREYAKDISPGQALLSGSAVADTLFAPAKLASKTSELLGGSGGPTLFKGSFDIYDAAQRKQAFSDEMTGKILSGLTDVAVTWYTDPLAKIGKGLSVARGGGKILGKEFQGVLDPKLGLKTNFKSEGWDKLLRYAVKDDTDATKLLFNRVVKRSSNPELLSSVLGDIKVSQFDSPELIAKYGSAEEAAVEVARTVLQASTGNKAAKLKIWQSPSIAKYAAQIDRAEGKLDPFELLAKAEREAGGDINAWFANPKNAETFELIKKEIQSIQATDQTIANAIMLTADEILGTGASNFAKIEARRIAKGENLSNILVTDIPAQGPFGLAMRVPAFFKGEVPSGWVRNKGINSSGSSGEVVAFMNQVKSWKTPDGSKLKQKFLNEYSAANTDEALRQRVLDKIEKEAMLAEGKALKLDDKVIEDVYKLYQKRRYDLVDAIKRGGKTGFIFEDQHIIPTRQLSSQIADSTPMIDLKAFTRVARTFTANGGKLNELPQYISSSYDVFNAIWKPSVLLRLGYTIRNVTEGSMRAIGMLGSVSEYMKYAGTSLGASVKEVTYNRIKKQMLYREAAREAGLPKAGFVKFNEVKEVHQRGLVQARYALNQAEDSLAAEKATLSAASSKKEKVAIKANIQKLEKDIENKKILVEQKVKAAYDFDAKYAGNPRVHKFSNVYVNDSVAAGINDAFAGDMGLISMNTSSASRRTAIDLQSQNAISRINTEGGLKSKGYSSAIQPPKYDEAGKIIPIPGSKKVNTEYWNASYAAAREFRNDEVTRRLLAGQKVEDIVAAAKVDKKLRKNLSESGVRLDSESIRLHVKKWDKSVKEYFPDEALRKRIGDFKQELTINDIRNTLEGRRDLSPIHGESFAPEDAKRLWIRYQDFTAKAFKYLGALPEDMLVRHPIYAAVYRRSMDELVNRKVAEYGKEAVEKGLTSNQFIELEKTARRMALRQLEATAYTINRYSGPGALFQYFAPFYAAFENTFKVWGRLAYENPEIVGRLNLLWDVPERTGLTVTDERTGETYVTMQLGKVIPDWLEEKIGKNTRIKFPKQAVNLIFQGEPWWSPGFGPIAQIPANYILKNSPDVNEQLTQRLGVYVPARGILDAILPMGPTQNWQSILLSSSQKRLLSLMKGTADSNYVSQLQSIAATERQRYKDGSRPDEPTFDEIRSKNDWLMTLRFVSALTLPFQPTFTSEYEPWVQLWQKYQTEGIINDETPAERFYKAYPDYFTLAYSGSAATTGMDFTSKAIYNAKQNRNLVAGVYQTNPYLIQLITNNGQVENKFDEAAYVWQMKNSPVPGSQETFRGQLDPISEVKRQDVRAGWIEFNKLNDAINAQLETNGIASISSPEAEGLLRFKEGAIKAISDKYPEWANDRDTFTIGKWKETIKGIDKILQDEKFINNLSDDLKPAWAIMQDYMDSRDTVIAELQQQEALGGSASIDAESNAYIREKWDVYVSTMKKSNTLFSDWYDRFLEADKLEPIR